MEPGTPCGHGASRPACFRCARSHPRYPAAVSTPPLSAQDLRAAAEAHRELGPEYSDAIVDSFLEKIETRLEARLDARLAEMEPPRKQPVAKLSADQRRSLLTGVAIGVGGLGVPLSIMAYNATQIYSGGGGTCGPRSWSPAPPPAVQGLPAHSVVTDEASARDLESRRYSCRQQRS